MLVAWWPSVGPGVIESGDLPTCDIDNHSSQPEETQQIKELLINDFYRLSTGGISYKSCFL